MAVAPPKSLLPEGHVFITSNIMVSDISNVLFQCLCKKTNKHRRDRFDICICNDFFSYRTLDRIDFMLVSIHKKVVKKDWDAAFNLLDALTHYMWSFDQWVCCDDGKRVQLTNNAYGSSLITVLRALKKVGRLDTINFPSLECLLRKAAEWGDDLKTINCPSNYSSVCRAIGWRLFNGKFEEIQALEKARLEEWKETLTPKELEEFEEDDDDDDDEEEDDEEGGEKKPWFSKGEHENEDAKHRDLVLSALWKEYRDYLKGRRTK